MSKEFKKKADAEEQKAQEPARATSEPISFDNWFSTRLKMNRKLRVHHYSSVLAFFKNNDLTENETEAQYDSMLKVFGY